MTISLIQPDPPKEKDSWLARRKEELKTKEEKSEDKSPYAFKIESSIGGGSTLEGASYFRLFTMLMLGTAVLFVPFAFLYKERTYLQS